MEVKPGYKQTEVGVVPEDWKVQPLSEHFRIYAGGDVPKHSLSQTRSESHPHPIFANALQNNGLYGFTNERRAKGDSLTITARGYLGHAEYRSEDFFPIVRLLVLEPTGNLDARFTTFAVNDRVKFAFESTGVPQLTAPQVGKYSVAAPSLLEQRAIAASLSDVDTLLAKLDQLLAKKCDLKQAAMQQLLTGQTRLPGFSGEWPVKRLGDVCPLQRGFDLPTTQLRAGKYPVVYSNGVLCVHNAFMVKGPGVVTGRSGTIGNVHFVEDDFWPHNTSLWVTSFKSNSPKFVFYLLTSVHLDRFGTGSGVPTLNRNDVHAYNVHIPPTAEEQTAIATVLSDMDAEIAALEARREKTRALKQGMMQELLTGRIRLV